MRMLSLGDVVTIALKVYLFQLKQYFQIALFAHLWLLVPVYGWAKFFAQLALISHLVFKQLIEQPEDYATGQKQINLRFWKYFYANIIVAVRMFIIAIAVSLATFILLLLFSLLTFSPLPSYINSEKIFLSFILSLIIILTFLAIVLFFIVSLIVFYARFLLVEPLISVEANMSANQAVNRSWKLTEKFEFRIFWILNIALLILSPLLILLLLANEVVSGVGYYYQSQTLPFADVISLICLWIISSLIMPFFQSIKAVLYYDIRNRREGLDLEIIT